jgi:hypothetical protein
MRRCIQRVVLRNDGSTWRVLPIYIVENGQIYIECEAHSLAEVTELFRSGRLTVSPPETGSLQIPHLLWAMFSNATSGADDRGFLVELGDAIQQFQGHEGVVAACRNAFNRFRSDPSDANRLALKNAYDDVPEHLRCWLGSLDVKDNEIRDALNQREA